MTTPARNSYDEMPYVRETYPQTHPDRLATVATIFGMSPAPIDRCRVLELGCASGANLIPMAANLPESQFVGVDLSDRQVSDGQIELKALGLTNIELKKCDIREIDEDWGKFDYIIAHGVYSWIPTEVQEHLLRVCARNLSDNGVAYVSYNVYPGWHLLRMIRDMMRYHAAKYVDPLERAHHARALLLFLARSSPRRDHSYTRFLEHAVKGLDPHSDEYVFHEYLEDVNEPVYFHQFLERASCHKLQYLSEADVTAMATTDLPSDVNQVLSRLSADWIQKQQYLDFIHGRQFRESVLCHDAVPLDTGDRFERIRKFHLASAAKPRPQPGAHINEETFDGPHVGSLKTTYPIVKAALRHLGETWPASSSFADLADAANARSNALDPRQRDENIDILARTLWTSYLQIDLVELHVRPLPLVSAVSERPTATALARHQAACGSRVTNQRHESCELTEWERFVLSRLDGQHDRCRIVEEWLSQKPTDAETLALESNLDAILARLARIALLVS
jgi:methyltransferase-like protein/SAM-dependent methyltransferase